MKLILTKLLFPKHGLVLPSDDNVAFDQNWHCLSKAVLEPQAISRPNGCFSKKLTYDCSSVLSNEVPGGEVHLMSKTPVPQQICQKRPELGKNGVFFVFFVS